MRMNSANDGDAIHWTQSDWSNGTCATDAGCSGTAYSISSVYWNSAANASGLEGQEERLKGPWIGALQASMLGKPVRCGVQAWPRADVCPLRSWCHRDMSDVTPANQRMTRSVEMKLEAVTTRGSNGCVSL